MSSIIGFTAKMAVVTKIKLYLWKNYIHFEYVNTDTNINIDHNLATNIYWLLANAPGILLSAFRRLVLFMLIIPKGRHYYNYFHLQMRKVRLRDG